MCRFGKEDSLCKLSILKDRPPMDRSEMVGVNAELPPREAFIEFMRNQIHGLHNMATIRGGFRLVVGPGGVLGAFWEEDDDDDDMPHCDRCGDVTEDSIMCDCCNEIVCFGCGVDRCSNCESHWFCMDCASENGLLFYCSACDDTCGECCGIEFCSSCEDPICRVCCENEGRIVSCDTCDFQECESCSGENTFLNTCDDCYSHRCETCLDEHGHWESCVECGIAYCNDCYEIADRSLCNCCCEFTCGECQAEGNGCISDEFSDTESDEEIKEQHALLGEKVLAKVKVIAKILVTDIEVTNIEEQVLIEEKTIKQEKEASEDDSNSTNIQNTLKNVKISEE